MLLPRSIAPVVSRCIRCVSSRRFTGTGKNSASSDRDQSHPEIRTTDDRTNTEAEQRGRLKPEWSWDFFRKVLHYKPPLPIHPDGKKIKLADADANVPKVTIKMWQNATDKAQVSLDKYERLSYADREIYIEHLKAVRAKKLSYVDPATKHSVFTVLRLIATGDCCGNGCRHCPYGHKNAPPDIREKKEWNGAFYAAKQL